MPHCKKTADRTNGTFGFARHKSQRFAKPKEPFFANAPTEKTNFGLKNLRTE
jgi:hypothetical protein